MREFITAIAGLFVRKEVVRKEVWGTTTGVDMKRHMSAMIEVNNIPLGWLILAINITTSCLVVILFYLLTR